MTGGSSKADLAVCRRLLREGSKSFHAASLLLPSSVRDDACAVYAWCRVSDHAIDRGENPEAALIDVRSGLERIYAGSAEGPVERAFAGAASRHGIPRDVPDAMLEGFQWDVDGRSYDGPEQVADYCIRVGSTVGMMMTLLMGRSDPDTLRDACRLGAAMQLTNISRDVGEDAADSRLYLPREWLREEGVDPEAWLSDPAPVPGVRASVRRVLDAADALYAAAWPGIERLPFLCRPAIRAAALVYADIGRKVRDAEYDSVTSRVWTSRAEKISLVANAALARQGAWKSGERADSDYILAIVDERAAFLVWAGLAA